MTKVERSHRVEALDACCASAVHDRPGAEHGDVTRHVWLESGGEHTIGNDYGWALSMESVAQALADAEARGHAAGRMTRAQACVDGHTCHDVLEDDCEIVEAGEHDKEPEVGDGCEG